MTSPASALADLSLDHVTFYVDDVRGEADRMRQRYGFEVSAIAGSPADPSSVALGAGQVHLVLSGVKADPDTVGAYLARHGDGIGNIAIRTSDAAKAYEEAVSRGAKPVVPPAEQDGVSTAKIAAFGDLTHTFVQRLPHCRDDRQLPGFTPVPGTAGSSTPVFSVIDHFAVCVEDGQLTATEQYYQHVLGFRTIFTERVRVGTQAMNSLVVQNTDRSLTLTVIAPDTSADPGQIDDFLKNNDGPGVQHLALSTSDIVGAVRELASAGVRFLDTPSAYYDLLPDRIDVVRHPVEALRELNVLVDADHGGQLFQIFSRSEHPRDTFFVEVIERMGASTFGSNNIKALYEALEAGQAR